MEISLTQITFHKKRYLFVSVRDITRRKIAEEALRLSEEQLRTIVDSAEDAIISANERGEIIAWNKAAERIFGYTKNEIMGRPLVTIIPEEYRAKHQEGFHRYNTTKQSNIIGRIVELEALHKQGEKFPVELSLSTWTTTAGTFFTAIIRNISEKKKMQKMTEALIFQKAMTELEKTKTKELEEEIKHRQEAEEGLRKALDVKREFTSTVSHELRTPLAISKQAVSLLLREKVGGITPRQQEILVMANTNIDRLGGSY